MAPPIEVHIDTLAGAASVVGSKADDAESAQDRLSGAPIEAIKDPELQQSHVLFEDEVNGSVADFVEDLEQFGQALRDAATVYDATDQHLAPS